MFVNIVSTIDGRAQLRGRTGELGEEADLDMLLDLRAIADAVLIGYGHAARRGLRPPGRLRGAARAARGGGARPDPPAVLLSRGSTCPGTRGSSRRGAARSDLHLGRCRGRGAGARRAGRGRTVAAALARGRRSPTCARAGSPRCCRGRADAQPRAAGRRARRRAVPDRSPRSSRGEAERCRLVDGDGLPTPLRARAGVGAARRRRAVVALRAVAIVPRPCGSRERRARRGRGLGLGAATARRLRAAGATVTIADLNEERGRGAGRRARRALRRLRRDRRRAGRGRRRRRRRGARPPAHLGQLRGHRLGGEDRGQARPARARAVRDRDRAST